MHIKAPPLFQLKRSNKPDRLWQGVPKIHRFREIRVIATLLPDIGLEPFFSLPYARVQSQSAEALNAVREST